MQEIKTSCTHTFAGLASSWMMNDEVRNIVSLYICFKEVPWQRTSQCCVDKAMVVS